MNTLDTINALARDVASMPEMAPALESPLAHLDDPLTRLEARLRHATGPSPIDLVCADLFDAGGKRLRAVTCLVFGRAMGVSDADSVALAEVAELAHGATLLHDDVIDEADTRRGRPAARVRWTNTLSVLGGDFLLLRSLEVVAKLGGEALQAAHRRTLFALLEAEVAQHLSRREGDLEPDNYLAIAAGKTGALFAFACAAPAYLIEDQAAAEKLDAFGQGFGVAFQIADDVRDLLQRDPSKPSYLDLVDGIFSFPLRLAARDNDALARDLRATVDHPPSPEELRTLAARVLATEAISEAIDTARIHLQRSRDGLTALPFHAHLAPVIDRCDELDTQLVAMTEA